MNPNSKDLKVDLIKVNATIPIDIKLASKYSLFVKPLNGYRFKYNEEFSNLILRTENESLELGPCCILPETNNGDHGELLTLKSDIYDLECLIHHNKLVKIQDDFLNLSLIFEYKNQIFTPFKNYTSNLTYDLSVYKSIFDKLDARFSSESQEVKSSLQKAIIRTEKGKFFGFLDEKLHELGEIVREFSKPENKSHGFYFRTQLWNILENIPFMARTNLRPRGYAGDSEMMSMIYDNDYMGESTFFRLMHKHPLEQPGAKAVRNRRRVIANHISRIKDGYRKSQNHKFKILSIACGPAKELVDVILSSEDCEKFNISLLDQDQIALLEAKETINQIENKLSAKIDVDFLNESVRTLLAMPQINAKWGQFNFIYSMGLFDYLTPPSASKALEKLYELLTPGGEMIIGNFHVENPSRIYMEYWLDWVLYHRTEEDFTNLAKGISNAKSKIFFEKSKAQMFLHVTKPN